MDQERRRTRRRRRNQWLDIAGRRTSGEANGPNTLEALNTTFMFDLWTRQPFCTLGETGRQEFILLILLLLLSFFSFHFSGRPEAAPPTGGSTLGNRLCCRCQGPTPPRWKNLSEIIAQSLISGTFSASHNVKTNVWNALGSSDTGSYIYFELKYKGHQKNKDISATSWCGDQVTVMWQEQEVTSLNWWHHLHTKTKEGACFIKLVSWYQR